MAGKPGPLAMIAGVPMRVSVGFASGGSLCRRRLAREAHFELHSVDARFPCARRNGLPALELEFPEFALDGPYVDAEINQRAEEHVAADAAEDVEIESVHKLEAQVKFQYPNSNPWERVSAPGAWHLRLRLNFEL